MQMQLKRTSALHPSESIVQCDDTLYPAKRPFDPLSSHIRQCTWPMVANDISFQQNTDKKRATQVEIAYQLCAPHCAFLYLSRICHGQTLGVQWVGAFENSANADCVSSGHGFYKICIRGDLIFCCVVCASVSSVREIMYEMSCRNICGQDFSKTIPTTTETQSRRITRHRNAGTRCPPHIHVQTTGGRCHISCKHFIG